jgi:hypothetical protein
MNHQTKRSKTQVSSPHNILSNSETSQDILDECDELDKSIHSDKSNKKRVLTREQRLAANVRERNRVYIMNGAFADLRLALPITTGRKRRRMARLDIVEGAIEYIKYLVSLLESGQSSEINYDEYRHKLIFN